MDAGVTDDPSLAGVQSVALPRGVEPAELIAELTVAFG